MSLKLLQDIYYSDTGRTLTDEIKAMLEELKSEAASGTPSIEVIYKEGYGRQSNVSDSSEEEK